MRTWATSRYALSRSEVSAQLRNIFEHAIEQNNINHTWQLNQTNNQSIIRKRMWGPHQSPIYLARISLTNSIILELWKLHSCLCKIKRNKRLFETRRELKLLERKLDFRNLFEDWSLEDCLIIGVLKIIWKLNLRIGILEIKWRWKVEIKFGSQKIRIIWRRNFWTK